MSKEAKQQQTGPAVPEGHVLIDKSLLPLKYPTSSVPDSMGDHKVPGYILRYNYDTSWVHTSGDPGRDVWYLSDWRIESGDQFAIPKDHELAHLNGLWPDIDPGEGYEWVDRGLGWSSPRAEFTFFDTRHKKWQATNQPLIGSALGVTDLRYFERVAKVVEPKVTPRIWPPLAPPKGHKWVDRGLGWRTTEPVEFAAREAAGWAYCVPEKLWEVAPRSICWYPRAAGGVPDTHYFELVPIIHHRPFGLLPHKEGFRFEKRPDAWTNEGKPATFAYWSAVTEEWTFHENKVPDGNPYPSAYFEATPVQKRFKPGDRVICHNGLHTGLVEKVFDGGKAYHVVLFNHHLQIPDSYSWIKGCDLKPAPDWTPEPGTEVLVARKHNGVSGNPWWAPQMDEYVGKVGRVTYKAGHANPSYAVEIDGRAWCYAADALLPIPKKEEPVAAPKPKFKVGDFVRTLIPVPGQEHIPPFVGRVEECGYIQPLDPKLGRRANGQDRDEGWSFGGYQESIEPWTPKPGERVRILGTATPEKYGRDIEDLGLPDWASPEMDKLVGTVQTVQDREIVGLPWVDLSGGGWTWMIEDLEPVGPDAKDTPPEDPAQKQKVEDATRIWKLIKAVEVPPSEQWLADVIEFRDTVVIPLGIDTKPQEIKLDIPQLKFEWVAKDTDGHWFAFANRPRCAIFGWTDEGDLSRIDDLFLQPFPEVDAANSLFHFEDGSWKHIPTKL